MALCLRHAESLAVENNGNTLTSITGSNTTSHTWDFENRLNIDKPLAMLRTATTSYYQADGLGAVVGVDDVPEEEDL